MSPSDASVIGSEPMTEASEVVCSRGIGLFWRSAGYGGGAPSGGPGAEPRWGVRGRSPPEADGILVPGHTFFALSWSL